MSHVLVDSTGHRKWTDVRQSKRLRPEWLSFNYMLFFTGSSSVDDPSAVVSKLLFAEAGHALLPMLRDIVQGAYTPSDAERTIFSKLPDASIDASNMNVGVLPMVVKMVMLHQMPPTKEQLVAIILEMRRYVECLNALDQTDRETLPVIVQA